MPGGVASASLGRHVVNGGGVRPDYSLPAVQRRRPMMWGGYAQVCSGPRWDWAGLVPIFVLDIVLTPTMSLGPPRLFLLHEGAGASVLDVVVVAASSVRGG
jgi:hypothetical protein